MHAPKRTLISSLFWLLVLLCLAPLHDVRADTWKIAANNRDARDDGGGGSVNACWIGDTGFADACGLQWAATIPKGATILSAYVRVYSTVQNGSGNAYDTEIQVEDVDNATAFTGAGNNIYGRSYWGTTVTWSFPIPTGTYTDSPDISSLIQRIVDRPGWSSGNYINIAIWGVTAAAVSGTAAVTSDFSISPANAAELVVNWQPPSPVYRSIGTAADYTAGSVTATAGSALVTGTGTTWRSSNRGRGDRIRINGSDYVVHKVHSETSLTMTRPANTSYSGSSYTIARQFTTLSAWEDCIDGSGNGGTCAPFPEVTNDLVADNRNEVGIAYKDSVFADNLEIDGALTDASHTITLTADPGNRHIGLAGTGVVLDPAVDGHAMAVLDDFTRVEWLEVTDWTGDSSEGVHIDADMTTFEYMVVHDGFDTDGQDEADGFYLNRNGGDWTTTIRNSFVYNVGRAGIQVQNLFGSTDLTANIENVTLYNNGSVTGHTAEETGGISYCVESGNSVTINARNVLSVGNRDRDSDGDGDFNSRNTGCDGTIDWGTSDFNISSDNSAPPSANRWTGVAAVTQFVSVLAGMEDLHLKPGSDALDAGTALSSATDIDLEDRPKGAQWDIGADEAVTSGTCPVETRPWFDTDWQYRKPIALSSTLVARALSSFPALVVLDDDTQLGTAAQPDFDDIVFTAADGVTKLSHEIEAYDSGQGDLTAWVKIPYISNGSDTVIYIYYGNGTVGSQEDATGVWDANFMGVWHLKEVGAGDPNEFSDSTSNGNDARGGAGVPADVPTRAPAQIGFGQDFDNSCPGPPASNCSEIHIEIPNSPTLENVQESNFTVEAWFQADTIPPNNVPNNDLAYGVVLKRGTHEGLLFEPGTLVMYHYLTGDALQWINAGAGATGTDYHMVGTVDVTNGEGVIYINGSPVNTVSWAGGTPTREYGTEPWRIGMGGFAGGDWLWAADGRIDEVRISDKVRSPEWVATEYANQNDAQTFCKVCAQVTEVSLERFEATGGDGQVSLEWRTASELNNLGFHVHRASSAAGPYVRVTERVIPGLGSSPVGASYRYRDEGLTNGALYYYKLEDIETTGQRMFHGPVSASPRTNPSPAPHATPSPDEGSTTHITYGDPSANAFRVIERNRSQVVLELYTSGFHAEPLDDGTVRLDVAGLDAWSEDASLPVKHQWVEALAGRTVELVSVDELEVESIELRPTGAEIDELVASRDGTVRLRRRAARRPRRAGAGVVPAASARLLSVGFQGDVKKAMVELAPVRWDASRGRLLLAKRLRVRLSFRGLEPTEQGSRRARRQPDTERNVWKRLVTKQRGLYAVSYESLFDTANRRRTTRGGFGVRLSRQGESVPYHLEPIGKPFSPGSVLYFFSDGDSLNPYGTEAVYELERSAEALMMDVIASPASGTPSSFYWHELELEEDRLYQAALTQAPDAWLWDLVMSGTTTAFPFELSELADDRASSHMRVHLQGTSDFAATLDHHVRAYVNGIFMGEAHWDGKQPASLEAELFPGTLRNGENTLELQNVGDTAAEYSMVMLDRFSLRYPRKLVATDGSFEGLMASTAPLDLSGMDGAHVLDLTASAPRWLAGGLPFQARADRRYAVVRSDAVLTPDIRRPVSSRVASQQNQADYIVVGSLEFLSAAEPLLAQRTSEGLHVRGISTAEIYSAFGFGEATPQAIRAFLSYAYHQWQRPAPRYVLLLGDATYDFKDNLQTGVVNHLLPMMVKTTYLWTASDPTYAAVNGDDILPDFAIGRLPAANVDELRVMVNKILTYEQGRAVFEPSSVFVTDNADGAGNFEAHAEQLASTLPGEHSLLHLSQLGTAATREGIVTSFDEGASLMSYIGHGGIHLWADESLFDSSRVSLLSPQQQQPLLLTMNCLNGYFHFPYFDSLAEALVKAEGKGAIAAFSPSGLSLDAPAHRYHQALLEELFDSHNTRLGDAILAAQADYAETGAFPELLSIYHLIGDPALRLR